MTHPLTPREKVARTVYDTVTRFDGDTVGTHLGLSAMIDAAAPTVDDERRIVKSVCDDIADSVLTALASGSGDHAELARLAEAATPGPWFETEGHPSGRTYGIHAEAGPVVVFRGIAKPHGQGEHNAAFIAAANPATILALLAENAALREQVKFEKQVAYDENDRWQEAGRKLAEAVGLLREWMGAWFVDADSRGESAIADDTRKFLSKEAERG